MADYTDIDKLRDEALEAVEGALVEMLRGPWAGDTARSNAAMWAPSILAAAWPERDAVLAEVDQLRTDNERLREFIMTEREKCSFDGPLPTGSWPDVALQLIRRLLGRRDALQARIDAMERSAFESAGFTRGTERAAIVQLIHDGQAVYIHDPHNQQLQNPPTHERVVWRGPWVPEPRCPGCRQRLRDLRAANDNHTDCSVVAALGVDPQKEDGDADKR